MDIYRFLIHQLTNIRFTQTHIEHLQKVIMFQGCTDFFCEVANSKYLRLCGRGAKMEAIMKILSNKKENGFPENFYW